METYLTEYNIIKTYYGDQVAKRSQVPLINHIDEGIVILKSINASDDAIAAYCLHPILQSDDAVCNNIPLLNGYNNIRRIILTMEYRRVANNYLSKRTITSLDDIELSPMLEVNQMLWADKLQNQKDFRAYHLGKHDRSDILEQYFINWINKLKTNEIGARIRHGHAIEKCKIEADGFDLKVKFTKPQRAVTPGQSIVFYRGDEVLGGGIIK